MIARMAAVHSVRTSLIAWAVALTIHSAAAVAILRARVQLNDSRWRASEAPVEIDVPEPPPPPPGTRPQPPVEAPADPIPQPRVALRHVAVRDPVAAAVPPPPNQEPPVEAPKSAPPVFGVTMSSVVSGDATMAVPVGNTTMMDSRSSRAAAHPQAYVGQGPRPFAPAPAFEIATQARLLHEVKSADIYPAEARTLGIEGTVKLSVDIDEKGSVVEVRLLQRAGHGFDEAAARVLPQFRFSPALTRDGRAVPSRITYLYTFSIGD